MGVLPRTARPDVERFDLPLSDKLRSVIAAQMLRRSVTRNGCFQHGDGIHGPDRPGPMQRQALPRMFIEQRQDAEAAAVVGLILNEIESSRPAGLWLRAIAPPYSTPPGASVSAFSTPALLPSGAGAAPVWD